MGRSESETFDDAVVVPALTNATSHLSVDGHLLTSLAWTYVDELVINFSGAVQKPCTSIRHHPPVSKPQLSTARQPYRR